MKFNLLYILAIILLASCAAPKEVAYFQGIENMSEEEKRAMDQTYSARISTDDMLTINVVTPDRETSAPYNLPPYGYYQPGEAEVGISAETQNLYTYLVDEDGYIKFPYLGRVQLAGLTINEANRKMEELLKETLPNVLVNIQIVNFKVSIFGEVKNSNTYSIKSTRVSILDLIAMAGNLTINADRTNVLLVRDVDGKKDYILMNLTDPHIFASPYFYLRQNDVIVVQPNDAQKRNATYSNLDSYKVQLISTIMTSLSIIVSMIAMIK